MEEQNNFITSKNQPLTGKQKLTAGFLILSAVIVLFFGLYGFNKSIKAPFELKNYQPAQENVDNIDSETLALQKKDSDQDGLSDYDETFIYKTNPYNEDSDSDKINDKTEIDSGGNPICPVGTDCGVVAKPTEQAPVTEQPATNTGNIDLNSVKSLEDLQKIQAELPAESKELINNLPTELSATEIREMLKVSGMSEEMLNNITDEQLITTYKNTLESMKSQPQ